MVKREMKIEIRQLIDDCLDHGKWMHAARLCHSLAKLNDVEEEIVNAKISLGPDDA